MTAAPPDAAAVAAGLGAAMRAAGMPVGTGRSERLARALLVMRASTVAELHACALATLVSDPGQIETFERVFAALFGVVEVPPRPSANIPPEEFLSLADAQDSGADDDGAAVTSAERLAGLLQTRSAGPDEAEGDAQEDAPAVRSIASAHERLAGRDFAQLSPGELRRLEALMQELTIAVPARQTRRYAPSRDGDRPDLRRTLRLARRTGGEPVRLARRSVRSRPRRLVVLCDISGSMEPYARALLQLLYCAARGPARARTEVFTFATRLTRLTTALAAASPETMMALAADAAPDWSSGTKIGACLREFNDKYGSRGMARGAIVLIISDGWETGDPALLGAQMARLSRVAHKIVWANPRTQSERYRPEVGGMAAAWPYCDVVVSAHNFEALDDLLEAVSTPGGAIPPRPPLRTGGSPPPVSPRGGLPGPP